jgi:hypothetical protein
MTDVIGVPILVVSNGVTSNVSLAASGAPWRYLDSGVTPDPSWAGTQYDDSSWKSGPAPLGYGNGDESTVVSFGPNPNEKQITTYFRSSFYVPDSSRIYSLSARLVRNDGIAVYLNGEEVWRNNLPPGSLTASTLALQSVNGTGTTNILTQALNPARLRNGTNVVAVEVHQASPAGQDIRFDLELTGVALFSPPVNLQVTNTSSGIILRLPAEGLLWELWTATNLAPPAVWKRSSNTPVSVNGEWLIFLGSETNQNRYYRLQIP